MGYIEETGAAQFFRDARITPIYEGTNGIQAADLVNRKLSLANGRAFSALLADMLADAAHDDLKVLIDDVGTIGRRLVGASHDDRLAASYPFLTMTSVAVCGWLMERQARAASDDAFGQVKKTTARFCIEQVVPEALGLRASAMADASVLYEMPVDAFAV